MSAPKKTLAELKKEIVDSQHPEVFGCGVSSPRDEVFGAKPRTETYCGLMHCSFEIQK